MNVRIYIGNISSTTSDKDLSDLFGKSGSVISANIAYGIDNERVRHGYVVMSSESDAQKAISENNNTLFKGSRIKVIKAHPIDQDSNFFSNQHRFVKYRKR